MMWAGGYCHYAIIFTLTYRPCSNCLSFLLQTFPSPADSTFRDSPTVFRQSTESEVDRTRLQLALQQFTKENNSSPGDI